MLQILDQFIKFTTPPTRHSPDFIEQHAKIIISTQEPQLFTQEARLLNHFLQLAVQETNSETLNADPSPLTESLTNYEEIQDDLRVLSVRELAKLCTVHNLLYDCKKTAIREIAYAIYLKRTKQLAV